MRVWMANDQVYVSFEYNMKIVSALKSIGGGRWDPDRKNWCFPLSRYDQLVKLRDQYLMTGEVVVKSNKQHESRENHHLRAEKYTENQKPTVIEQVNSEEIKIRFKQHLIRKGYSPQTIRSYVNHLNRFMDYSGLSVDVYVINLYLLDLLETKKCSHAYCNQAINAIKLYLKVMGVSEHDELIHIDRPKKECKMPKVFSPEEVKRLFDATQNQKHKTALMIGYSCGLRVSEVTNLKLYDIDRDRMLVNIKQGKGRKDRITTLSKKMLEQLDRYIWSYQPKEWLFENQSKDGCLTVRTLQIVFHNSCEQAGIKKDVTFHF